MATPSDGTPLMRQYFDIKNAHTDAILFYRLGDFYEMFFDDAKIAAQELDITLTTRGKCKGEPIPLAGVPYHSYKPYVTKLLKRGYKVAICEQTSDPKLATGKKIVERAVMRVLTPGTLIDEDILSDDTHNYLVTIVRDREALGAAWVDISTGDCLCTSFFGPKALPNLLEEIESIAPVEIVVQQELAGEPGLERLARNLNLSERAVTAIDEIPNVTDHTLRPFFGGASPSPEVKGEPVLAKAITLLGHYLKKTQGERLEHLKPVEVYRREAHMRLDPITIRNLELLETLLGKRREGSLLGTLDRCSTSMGSRLLKHWLLHPLAELEPIRKRQDAVAALVDNLTERLTMRELLKEVYDIPRLLSKVTTRHANPRDLACLDRSLRKFPALVELGQQAGLAEVVAGIHTFPELVKELGRTLVDEPPLSATDGGLIREGFSEELDELRVLRSDASGWIRRKEESLRKSTGIRSLKIKYNKLMGYFIAVTKPNVHLVPEDFVRKQQLVGGDRFVTTELKEKEEAILNADEKAKNLEYEIFCALRDRVAGMVVAIQEAASRIAELDVYAALAETAATEDHCRPVFVEDNLTDIVNGRHPVVEAAIGLQSFVPNHVKLGDPDQVVVLTGPNMSGKSTYLRQAALITILAQIGAFVPAESARVGITDQVFTRVGATDDLSRGESTFMVEMRETAYILQHATERSLVILDEVGRGTSTYDGLSLAWAIVEHLHESETCRPKTLFATHYHELTELANLLERVQNLSVLVEERGEDVLFLHQIVTGPADKSYGIHVAKLAGFPTNILTRAKEILFQLEQDEQRDIERKKIKRSKTPVEPAQLTLFAPAPSPVLDKLKTIDLNQTTPLEALILLNDLKEMI